jgi:TRAP-type C4-dicarboxylate transport system substrate-binding protein
MGGNGAKQWTAVTVLAASIALTLAGCLGSNSDKAGGAQHQKQVVLTMANGNSIPVELDPFKAAVARLSTNTIRIKFKNDWRKGDPGVETGVIGDVEAGKADLGWTGSRAFDSVGVASFDALHAPLLIDSYALEHEVLESSLVDDMLDGLEPLGVIGLGVLPGPMRKPLGVAPLVRPEDYRGKAIAMSRSRVAQQALRALGASAKEIPAGGGIQAFDGVEAQIGAIEGNGYDSVAKNLTANVNLWPRPQVLFMNKKAFAALSDTQRDALRAAVRSALPATMAIQRNGEKESAAILCRRKLTFLAASDNDLAALRGAVGPVYHRLERDTVTKDAIEQIQTMREEQAASTKTEAPTCHNARSQTSAAGKATPIDGAYRVTTTAKEGVAAGAPDSPRENYGTLTAIFDRGHFEIRTRNGPAIHAFIAGTYTVRGDVLEWTVEKGGGVAPRVVHDYRGGRVAFRWSLYRDQLTLGAVRGKVSPENYRAKPWRRTGDAP